MVSEGSGQSPLATVITVNYNSLKMKEVISESIKAILSLDYRPLEVIIVDNGSTDGSYEYIKSLVEAYAPKDIKVRLLKLSKNYGFTGANSIAFTLRDKDAKYVALINDDLAPERSSLRKLIEYLEKNEKVAGVQGKILTWDGKRIDTAGLYLTQFGTAYARGYGMPAEANNTEAIVSYVDGAYSVYRVESILKAGGLFNPEFFLYGDDYELGVRLWRTGYVLKYIPIIAGRHYRGATFSRARSWQEYFEMRSSIATSIIYDERWFFHIVVLRLPMTFMRFAIERLVLRRYPGHIYRTRIRGMLDGVLLGCRLRKKNMFPGKEAVEPRVRIPWYSLLLRRIGERYVIRD